MSGLDKGGEKGPGTMKEDCCVIPPKHELYMKSVGHHLHKHRLECCSLGAVTDVWWVGKSIKVRHWTA